MHNPYFSIIIPVYNTDRYLCECLDSILCQKFVDWECICVDDGSTDNSGMILDEYKNKDNRIRVYHQKNLGVSAARNYGLKVALGEWISFVDSDDTIDSEYFNYFIKWEEKADINFFNIIFYNERKLENSYKFPLQKKANFDKHGEMLLNRAFNEHFDGFGLTHNKFIRGAIAKKITFNINVNFYEDEIYALEVCNQCKTFSFMEHQLYNYRIHDNGLTRGRVHDYRDIAHYFEIIEKKLNNEYLKAIAYKRADIFLYKQLQLTGKYIDFYMYEKHKEKNLIKILLLYIIFKLRQFKILFSIRRVYRKILHHGEFSYK